MDRVLRSCYFLTHRSIVDRTMCLQLSAKKLYDFYHITTLYLTIKSSLIVWFIGGKHAYRYCLPNTSSGDCQDQ